MGQEETSDSCNASVTGCARPRAQHYPKTRRSRDLLDAAVVRRLLRPTGPPAVTDALPIRFGLGDSVRELPSNAGAP
jgi:hypothetical protein